MAFQCTLVTPEHQAFDGSITQAIVPAHDGLLGILTDRAPLLTKLGVGPLRLDLPNGQKRYFFINAGVAQMRDNRLTILSTEAMPASEIDYEAAHAEYVAASAQHPVDEQGMRDREQRMARARAMQDTASMK